MDPRQLQPVLEKYPPLVRSARIDAYNSNGFSGARLWRLDTAEGPASLRCWPPEQPTPHRLAWIHRQLLALAAAGLDFIPRLWPTSAGETWIRVQGRLWEIASWMPGTADFHLRPTFPRLHHAMQSLAQVHGAWACQGAPDVRRGESPAMTSRLRQLLALDQTIAQLREALRLSGSAMATEVRHAAGQWMELAPRAAERVLPPLQRHGLGVVGLQPCLRDVWHDHLLFEDQRLTGLIDFGAMNIECPAADLARCLRSLLRGPPAEWNAALEAYQRWRRLSDAELLLLPLLDQTAVILGPSLWLRWLIVERRTFTNPTAAVRRLGQGVADLRTLVEGPMDFGVSGPR